MQSLIKNPEFFDNDKIVLFYDTVAERWLIRYKSTDEIYDPIAANNKSGFLQIFYEDPINFFDRASKVARDNGIDVAVINTLPFRESITFCFVNGLHFWLELALKWIEPDVLGIDKVLEGQIRVAMASPKFPQELKKRLNKLLRKKK